MKIALLTYHRSYNYGAILQAVATRIALQQLGHDVYYINYWPEHQRALYREQPIIKVIKYYLKYAPLGLLTIPHKLLWQNIRRYKYNRFIKKYIAPFYGGNDWEYDVLVCGSDQIWRKQPVTGEYNPYYFGDNDIKAKRKISYASSSGRLPVTKSEQETFVRLLDSLDYIAVREKELYNFIKEKKQKDVTLVLDPTLLLSSSQWIKYLSVNNTYASLKKYVLIYDLGNLFTNNDVEEFARNNNLYIKKITQWVDFTEQRWKAITDTPSDFLDLFNHASFVLTSSYHGMVFSVIFNKPFFVASKHHSGRFSSFLKEFNLENRWIEESSISKMKCTPIDYSLIKEKKEKLVEHSIGYLKNHLG